MRETWEHIRSTLRNRLPEWIIAWSLVFWGLIVFSVPGLFGQGNYINMADFASQTTWGGAAMIVGVLRLFFLTINGWWKPSASLRAVGAFLSLLGWAAILISYITLPSLIPNIATIGALAALDLTSLWYASEDAAMAGNGARAKRIING